MIRKVVAVLIGYLSLAQGLVYVVTYSFIDPLVSVAALWLPTVLTELVALGVGVGLVVGLIAGRASLWPGRIVAGLGTIMMLGNIILGIAVEPIWFKLCVMVITLPAVVVGERAVARRRASG